ncbi:hypothetical protein [Methylomonas sp. LWB]|uniref:hypothetical protein n=1 Tax=unclassified Methylomonas TaxID=2608980 RepID=UPI0011151A7D|nr:hypothetical protein [Methylomonas sp. LWB]
MKNRNLMFGAFLVISLVSLASCSMSERIASLTKKNVPMASGVDFKSNRFVVVNSLDGKEVASCGDSEIPSGRDAYKNNESGKGDSCGVKIIQVDDAVLNALKVTAPVEGRISKDGKEVNAKFFVSVLAIYEGSVCTVYYNNGKKYKVCVPEDSAEW